MADAKAAPAVATEETQQDGQPGRPSIDILRETKPAADLSIKDSSKAADPEPEDTHADVNQKSITPGVAKIETVFEKLDMSSDKSDSTTDSAVVEEKKTPVQSKPAVEIPPLEFEIRENIPNLKGDKNASDIFSLKELDNSKQKNVNSIWSINGAPSGRINRKKDLSSSIFPVGCMGCKDEVSSEVVSPRRFIDAKEASEHHVGHIDNTPRKRPMSSKPRNPITGGGIEDEEIKKNNRRKDGNPLLGIGYEEVAPFTNPSRVPPGGHSKGLW